ncbi:MAG: thiamine pyrophosphate-dependent dehydrogenase E1 component subunit alpha [Deltaproteobacteria bacterium]|nr:thiamine pyrophosphate-dependent dehydrogenase E1 component subunit alpha [Deltaproteobacteria bacterium]
MGKLSTEDLIKMHYYMLLTREFEDRMSKLKRDGKIDEGIHRSIGEEAVHVGATYCLRKKEDVLVPSLRSRAAFFVKGLDVRSVMAAVHSRSNSLTGGKESSHHLGATEYGILLTTGFIGSQYPLAVGAALALKLKKTDQVVMCFFGDGAASRGDFHESLNMAAVLSLPVIFVCENNQIAMGTPIAYQMRNPEIVSRAVGYGMHGARVDGQDVMAVYETVHDAVELARKGKGPSLVECLTYRFAGHTDFEPNWRGGRPEDEYNHWRGRDPIDILEKRLFESGQMDEAAKTGIKERVQQEIDDAVAYAESQPRLCEEDLYSCVYCDELSSIGS